MKVWREVWQTYYTVATRRNYWMQLFLVASWPQRITAFVSLSAILYGIASGRFSAGSTLAPYVWLVIPQVTFLAILDAVRTKTFTENFGGLPEETAPPESEGYRRDRYVLFRDALKQHDILGSDVKPLVPLIDARLDMEQHHNELMKKFGLFASGILTALVVPWLKGLSGLDIGAVVAAFSIILFTTMLALWLIPSRKARLRELKYFMMMYERE